MTYYSGTNYDLSSRDRQRPSRKVPPQTLIGHSALAFIVLACAWTLYVNVAGPDVKPLAFAEPARPTYNALLDSSYFQPAPETFAEALPKGDRLAVARPVQQAQAEQPAVPFQVATADPNAAVAEDAPPAAESPVQIASVPLPAPRPAQLRVAEEKGPSPREVAQATKANLPASTPEQPSIFEKLFGKLRPSGPMLAYAPTDGGVSGDGQSMSGPPYDRQTAVYDISARTVYMPNGTKLEAHSGLGSRIDDPRYVHERMRGSTPPHVYDLSLRESLFHGVQAIRLNPVGGNAQIFGRTGLLAHTYMLGPKGDSNGCVSFRDYDAFLRAYRNGEVKRLVVVASLK